MSPSETPVLTRLETVLLVVAPLAMLVGGLLLVRYDDQDWNGVLTSMAAHPGRSDLGWILMLFGAALVLPPALALPRLIRVSRPRLAAVTTVTTALAWASVPMFAAGALFMRKMADAPDRAAQTNVLDAVNDGPFNVAFLLGAIGAVGYIALAVGLARSRTVPIGAAVLVALGGAGTQLVMGGPLRSLLLVAIVVLLAGHGWIAASARTSGRRTASPTSGSSASSTAVAV